MTDDEDEGKKSYANTHTSHTNEPSTTDTRMGEGEKELYLPTRC